MISQRLRRVAWLMAHKDLWSSQPITPDLMRMLAREMRRSGMLSTTTHWRDVAWDTLIDEAMRRG